MIIKNSIIASIADALSAHTMPEQAYIDQIVAAWTAEADKLTAKSRTRSAACNTVLPMLTAEPITSKALYEANEEVLNQCGITSSKALAYLLKHELADKVTMEQTDKGHTYRLTEV